MGFLTDDEIAELRPARETMFPSPIPTQVVSSDEFAPIPQTPQQREVEARIKSMADEIGARQNRSRRGFLSTTSGMAAAFLAMNEVYGPVFGVSRAEAQEPERAEARAASLRGQFIMDVHTHFLRDDTRHHGLRGDAPRRRPRRLEPGAQPRRAEPRKPEIRQLVQGSLPRQRHQGRADQRRAVRRADRLVPHQRDEVQCPQAGQRRRGRHAPLHEPRHLHPRPARLDGCRWSAPSRN